MANGKTRSLFIAGAGVLLLGAAVFTLLNIPHGRGVQLVIPGVMIALLGAILLGVGIRSAVLAGRGGGGPREDYRHTYRLFGAVVAVLALALTARALAIPPSFGEFGSYRSAAIAAARGPVPGHQGKAVCAKCHPKQAKLQGKDAHRRVQCETCHGMGKAHAAAPKQVKQKRDGSKGACLTCHRQLDARPGAFGQVNWEKHYAFVGVKDPSIKCIQCHDPHEPLFMDRDLNAARMHPLINRCRDCHTGSQRSPLTPRPKDHPVIFQCKDCHKAVAEDFAKRPHKKVRCTTCHLFFQESAFAGRIIRDADPRFCLLCHRKASYREASQPAIEWPAHREDMGGEGSERCVDCHQTSIIHTTVKKGEQR